MTRDENARMIKVEVSNLRIRTSPTTASDDNITGDHCEENAYYYILDEHVDNGITWYKIGNDEWIGSGTYTKLYE